MCCRDMNCPHAPVEILVAFCELSNSLSVPEMYLILTQNLLEFAGLHFPVPASWYVFLIKAVGTTLVFGGWQIFINKLNIAQIFCSMVFSPAVRSIL